MDSYGQVRNQPSWKNMLEEKSKAGSSLSFTIFFFDNLADFRGKCCFQFRENCTGQKDRKSGLGETG